MPLIEKTQKQHFAAINVMYLFAKNIALEKLQITIAILLNIIMAIETLLELFH